MKNDSLVRSHQSVRHLSCVTLGILTLFAEAVSPLGAQTVTWNRQASGQQQNFPCSGAPFNWPDNNFWTQQEVLVIDTPCGVQYVAQPSNWSSPQYPNGASINVIIDSSAPTALNTAVTLNSLTVSPGGGLDMLASGVITAQSYAFGIDGTITNSGGAGQAPIMNIPGTFGKTGGAGTLSMSNGLVFNLQGGTIQVTSGTLALSGNGVSTGGAFEVSANAVLDLTGGFSQALFGGTYTGSGSGAVLLSGGLLFPGPQGTTTTFNLPDSLFQWTGGGFATGFGATGAFVNVGTITMSGAGTKGLAGTGFANDGTLVQADTGTFNISSGSILNNNAGGTFEMRGDALIDGLGGGGTSPAFNNTGLVRKTAGTGISSTTASMNFNLLGGTIQADTGTIRLGPGSHTGGNFIVGSGAAIQLTVDQGGFGPTVVGTYTATGAGTLQHSAGTLFTGGGGVIFYFDPGVFQWTGGHIGAGGNAVTNQSSMTVAGAGGKSYQGLFNNIGTFNFDGTGDFALLAGTNFSNTASGVFDIRSDGSIPNGGGGGAGPLFTNSGFLAKTGGTGTSTISDIGFTNSSGTIRVDTGTLVITNFGQTNNGIIELNGGTLTVPGGLNLDSGSLIGSGTVGANLNNNNGTVSPGYSAGTITVGGDYNQGPNGILLLEIGGVTGAEYDRLVVNGTANFGGTLNVTLIDGFRPHVGHVFQIISPTVFTGAFTAVNTTGFTGQIEYAAGAVTMTVLTVPDIPLNIATRLRVNPDPNQLIGGVIVTGTEPKRVLIRAIGPSLSAILSGALADPTLELFQGSTLLESNDNWRDSNQAAIKATGIPPTNDLESAIVRMLDPGAYTAVVRGQGGTSGIGLVEVYDLDLSARSKLANIATRGFVDTDDNVMIGGFIMGGNGGANGRVVIRAIGPSLTPFGIAGALQDPVLELYDANGSTLMTNDDWQSSQQAEIEATGLAPTDIHESAIVTSLLSGNYTAIVRGKNNTTGVAVVEVYNIL